MKAIIVKREFEDGYIEITYRNHTSIEWWHFVPDPRKRKMNRKKYWPRGGGGIGSVDGLCGNSVMCGVSPSWKEWYVRRHAIVVDLLMEAARRYDQRYAIFGELANAQMPPDPDMEVFFDVMRELIRQWSLRAYAWPSQPQANRYNGP